jgi:hypothetical protein
MPEGRAVSLSGEWKAAVPAEWREIRDDFGHMLGAHEIFDDDKVERVMAERARPQPIKFEQTQNSLRSVRMPDPIMGFSPEDAMPRSAVTPGNAR